jgi:serine/threonine protein phosphatase PrpC
VNATSYVKEHLIKILQVKIPAELPNSLMSVSGGTYAEAVRDAVTDTFETLNATLHFEGDDSGCTCTVAIVSGSLITVANVGSCDAILDAFQCSDTMTVCCQLLQLHGTLVA